MNPIYKILSLFGYVGHLKLGAVELSRSPKWPSFKREFEKTHPKECAICGRKKAQLHHRSPFHSHPELELESSNVVWLCEGLLTPNHHIICGHLGDFKSYNNELDNWIEKFRTRPYWNGAEWKAKVETLEEPIRK